MSRSLKLLLVTSIMCALPLTVSFAQDGPTYFASFSATGEAGAENLIGSASATYTFGVQVPIRDNRHLLLGYRSIRIAGEGDDPQSLNLGFVDYYSMGKLWEMGVWLGSDINLKTSEDEDPMSGLVGISAQRRLSGQFTAELYNTWTLRNGRDFMTFGLNIKVTPSLQ